MPIHPKLTQAGRSQTYTQKVAAALNWYRRCVMGLLGQLSFQSGFFITRAPEYAEMSNARKTQLRKIEQLSAESKKKLKELISEIEIYQTLPITLADEEKGKTPKRRVKKTDDLGGITF